MRTHSRGARLGTIGVAVAVGLSLFSSQSAFADETPTPTPTNSSSDSQNDAHDHGLGSTLGQSDGSGVQSLAVPEAFTPAGVPGFDVSSFQGPNVDFSGAYAKGARFVYIKASESYNSTNDYFANQWSGATNAGLIRGAYHFADPFESGGVTQANYFLAHGGTWTPDGMTLPPVLDLEANQYGAVDGDHCWSKTPAQLTAWVSDFSNTVLARTGIRPTIYTNTDFWHACMADSTSFGANPLFFATRGLTSPGTLPASWSTYSFWQFADDSKKPKFPGDQDVFNGDLAALKVFAANATPDSNYLNALYHDYLDRTPAPTELADWETRLSNGTPIGAVAEGFVDSDEYRRIRINAAYEDVLGRAGEPSGVQTALDAMHAGTITTDDIETAFYASDEYYQNHGGTDQSFVASLYTNLLNRTGSKAEIANWVAQIPTMSRPWVISQFWDANETISARVSAMYQFYLGRTPDAAGLKSWVAVALQIGDSGLREGFTGSAEYYSRSQTRTY